MFIHLLRKASKAQSDERLFTLMADIWTKSPEIRPQIAQNISKLTPDNDFPDMVDFLEINLSTYPEFFHYFPPDVLAYGRDFPQALNRCVLLQQQGREDLFVHNLIEAMRLAHRSDDKWQVLILGAFCLNKLGRYWRAHAWALSAHEISRQCEDKTLLQRSRFAILHSKRLSRRSDVRTEYAREFKTLCSGNLLYSSVNQNLVPSFAAMHLMDLNRKEKVLAEFLGASKELASDEFSRMNHMIVEARFAFLSGNAARAKRFVHELVERVDLSLADEPTIRPVLSLVEALDLRTPLSGPTVIPASSSRWRSLDLALARMWADINESNLVC